MSASRLEYLFDMFFFTNMWFIEMLNLKTGFPGDLFGIFSNLVSNLISILRIIKNADFMTVKPFSHPFNITNVRNRSGYHNAIVTAKLVPACPG